MSQTKRLLLTHVAEARHVGDRAHGFQIALFSAFFQKVLKLERNVEMIFDGSFAAPRYDDDGLYAGCDRFFDNVLYERLINERQHLFRRRFRRRQESRAETCCWKN